MIEEIANNLHTQDNRATAHPFFIVQEKKRHYGYDSDYSDNCVWVDDEGNEADGDLFKRLNDIENHFPKSRDCPDWLKMKAEIDGWTKVYYVDRWEHITGCFTEDAAKDYIGLNQHRHGELRIYAASLYRNREMIAIREYLIGLAAGPCSQGSQE